MLPTFRPRWCSPSEATLTVSSESPCWWISSRWPSYIPDRSGNAPWRNCLCRCWLSFPQSSGTPHTAQGRFHISSAPALSGFSFRSARSGIHRATPRPYIVRLISTAGFWSWFGWKSFRSRRTPARTGYNLSACQRAFQTSARPLWRSKPLRLPSWQTIPQWTAFHRQCARYGQTWIQAARQIPYSAPPPASQGLRHGSWRKP